jgi:preprotein translocase subunit SecE
MGSRRDEVWSAGRKADQAGYGLVSLFGFCGVRYRASRQEGLGVAKTSPGDFIRQVKAETAKVVWPTRKETVTTTIMVGLMTVILGVFFFGVDQVFSRIVRLLLSSLS